MQAVPAQQGSPVTGRTSPPVDQARSSSPVQQGGPEAPRVALPGQERGVPSTASVAPSSPPRSSSEVVGGGGEASAAVTRAGVQQDGEPASSL